MEDFTVLNERLRLAAERIREIPAEETVQEPFRSYFNRMSAFAGQILELNRLIETGETENWTLEQLQRLNRELYADILPENYGQSYGNPAYAAAVLGDTFGQLLSFLYSELRAMIVYAYEQRREELVISLELLVEIYNAFEGGLPGYREVQQIIYWFTSDYCDVIVARRVRESVDPELDFAAKIIRESDLEDLRYLYRYGEYIDENQLETARYLNSLSEEQIRQMADVYTEGYRLGFVHGGKDLSKKQTVGIRYILGFERMIRRAIENFAGLGLKPVIYRSAVNAVNRRGAARIGYYGAIPNKQFDYDHREDAAIFLDKRLVERKLSVTKNTYEAYKALANGHAGPACVETFGETPFSPEDKPEALRLNEKQQKLQVFASSEQARLTNQYIIGEERSFTIIAFPVPEIGPEFPEIFQETIRLNTLDYQKYERIQQILIDTLDKGRFVHVLGRGENQTDLTVALAQLNHPEKETLFENCVADVNIPVGEVFTSPRLEGTNGVLQVSRVYLDELRYDGLSVTLKDGMVTDYSCKNFDTEEAGKRYFLENVMAHHETLPLGEFAIGTNTTAYAMAAKYGIADRLPILIAEKMGPHFALGDTCYSWDEDNAVYNPDGKEIIARENTVSRQRLTDPSKAYFNCHTDITIPYDELGLLEVIDENGGKTDIIREGRFVLPGTEELNIPLDEMQK